jgi:cytosine/uracil/thiamine/allantoin permease
VFTFAQLLTVVLIHFSIDSAESRRAVRLLVLAALVAAASVFIRSAAAGLVLAVVMLLLKERLWRRAVLFGGIVAICLLPWMWHVRTHAPSDADRSAHGG